MSCLLKRQKIFEFNPTGNLIPKTGSKTFRLIFLSNLVNCSTNFYPNQAEPKYQHPSDDHRCFFFHNFIVN